MGPLAVVEVDPVADDPPGVEEEAALDRDVGDVGAPDPIRTLNRQPLEQVGINPVLGMRHAGLRRPIDGLQSHQPHQTPHPMTADAHALPLWLGLIRDLRDHFRCVTAPLILADQSTLFIV